MDDRSRYYAPSGRVPADGAIYCLLWGCVAALVGGTAYPWLQWVLPGNYFNAIFCAGLGFAIGRTLAWAGHAGHVRNPRALMLFGIACGMLAEYVQWAVFVALHAAGQEKAAWLPHFMHFLTDPADMLASILEWGRCGVAQTQHVGAEDTEWLVLFLGWGIEALGIIGLAAGIAKGRRIVPYSETMGCWMQEQVSSQVLAMPNPVQPLLDDLERGSIRVLLSCAHASQTPCMRLGFYGCKGDNAVYLSLTSLVGEKMWGRSKITEQPLITHIAVTRAQAWELRKYLSS